MNTGGTNGLLPAQLLTPARLAWVLDVGHSTIEEWTRRREIASFKKGKVRRYEPAAVWRFICSHTIGTKSRSASASASRLDCADWERIERLIATQLSANNNNQTKDESP